MEVLLKWVSVLFGGQTDCVYLVPGAGVRSWDQPAGPVWWHGEGSGQTCSGRRKLSGVHVRCHQRWQNLHLPGSVTSLPHHTFNPCCSTGAATKLIYLINIFQKMRIFCSYIEGFSKSNIHIVINAYYIVPNRKGSQFQWVFLVWGLLLRIHVLCHIHNIILFLNSLFMKKSNICS